MFRNVVVLGKVRVASPAEKMKEMKLRFRHAKKRCEDVPVRCERLVVA